MTAEAVPATFRFGRFELQPDERRLLADHAPVTVSPRAFDVLVLLVERSGHLVTKDELLDHVWAKVVVEENTVQAQISALRKILGPDAIATVPRRGYRFALEVQRGGDGGAGTAKAPGKHNLPQQLTSFIGRDREIAQLKHLLDRRLLTLTGTGGCGKTRLALQIATNLLDKYPDGVWLVELAPLADADLVPQAVAAVLGVKEERGNTLSQSIIAHLARKCALG